MVEWTLTVTLLFRFELLPGRDDFLRVLTTPRGFTEDALITVLFVFFFLIADDEDEETPLRRLSPEITRPDFFFFEVGPG